MKRGDVVQLNSGGPLMTIVKRQATPYFGTSFGEFNTVEDPNGLFVETTWFDSEGEPDYGIYHMDLLRMITPR